MIMLVFPLAGIVTGVLMARKRGGSALDMAQYAVVLGIIGALVGLFAGIVLARMM